MIVVTDPTSATYLMESLDDLWSGRYRHHTYTAPRPMTDADRSTEHACLVYLAQSWADKVTA